jgi:hypothetical protein
LGWRLDFVLGVQVKHPFEIISRLSACVTYCNAEIALRRQATRRRRLEFSSCAAAAALVAASFPANAAADAETQAEIRALKAKLRQLERRLDDRAQTQRPPVAKSGAGGDAIIVKGDDGRIWPDKFFYKGITITPGGFIALESVWRSRWIGADVNTPFQNIPYGFGATGHTNEFRFSARQSRLAMLVQGDVNPSTHISGYVETDFLGAAQTANSNESNSYNLRVRHLYTNVDSDDFGLHLLAGQSWSLVTMNTSGIRPDTVNPPPTIDAQYVPGFTWARQPQLRLVKDFGKQLWVAFSAETAANTFTGYGALPPGLIGTTSLPLNNPILFGQAAGGGLFNSVNSYSLNRMPDMVAKVAWDPSIGDRTVHLESFGLLRDFTDRAYWGNHSVWAGGFGGGLVVPILPKLLDFQASGAIGRGIGRYGSAQISDATWSVTGSPLPIHERMLLVGATLHATPQTDVYAFAGGEFASGQPQYNQYGSSFVVGGYGNPFFNNLGCDIENEALSATPFLSGGTAANAALGGALSCAGQIKDVRQITGGVWHTLYQGPFGKLKAGAQYSYTVKDAFPGFGPTPKGVESMVLTSIRYYPF